MGPWKTTLTVTPTLVIRLRETPAGEAWLGGFKHSIGTICVKFLTENLWLLARLMMENHLWLIRSDQHHGGIVSGAVESMSSESTLRSQHLRRPRLHLKLEAELDSVEKSPTWYFFEGMKDARLRERWKTAEVWYQGTGSESLQRSQERPLLKVPQLAVETPGYWRCQGHLRSTKNN